MSGFREAVLASGNSLSGWNGFSVFGASSRGSLPTPFDAPAGNRLWGPQGSHPLAAIALEELVARSSNGIDGDITIKEPVKIGEALAGHIKLTARKDIKARSAAFRLIGALLVERNESREERDSKGNVTRSERWNSNMKTSTTPSAISICICPKKAAMATNAGAIIVKRRKRSAPAHKAMLSSMAK